MEKKVITCNEIIASIDNFQTQKNKLIAKMDADFDAMHQEQTRIFLHQMLSSLSLDTQNILKTYFDWSPEKKNRDKRQPIRSVFRAVIHAVVEQDKFSEMQLTEINNAWLPFGVRIEQYQTENGYELEISDL